MNFKGLVKHFDIDRLPTRLMIIFLLYLLFIGLTASSLDLALVILSPLSVLLTLYFNRRDEIFRQKRQQLVNNVSFGLIIGILLYLRKPSIEEFLTVFIRNAVGEELIFRFGMLGILGIHLKISSPLRQSTWALILLNASLFSLLHHYVYLSTFTLSVLYAYSFLRFGIVTTIAFHLFWNLHHRFDIVLLIIGGIIAYESYYTWRKRSRAIFRWYKYSKK